VSRRKGFTEADIRAMVKAGMIKPADVPAKPKRGRHNLCAESFEAPPDGAAGPVSFVVPAYTVSETNVSHSGKWKKIGRTGQTRRAVSAVLGKYLRYLVPFAEAYHAGHVVRVHFERLGGTGLDAMANLGPALKAAEDAVALMLGANDGAANWVASCGQKPGGGYGVRITLAVGVK
jgi:hypothetical protein